MKPLVSRFQKFEFTPEELGFALQVSPYFWCYLQNKIAERAMAVVEIAYTDSASNAILEHERLKAQVEVLEELMQELTPPQEQPSNPTQEF